MNCVGCGSPLGAGITVCPYCNRENVIPAPPAKDPKLTFNFGGGEKTISLSDVSNPLKNVVSSARENMTQPSPAPQAKNFKALPLTDAGSRIGAHLIDMTLVSVLSAISAGILGIAYWVWAGWANGCGKQSLGYMATGQYLVGSSTREPIGGGAGVSRTLLHTIDALTLGIGYVIGLATGQTIADRISNTVVVKAR